MKAGTTESEPLPSLTGILANDRGIALIIAISLLAIMSVLGSMLLNSSTSEIQLSGNYRNKQEAFYAANRTVEYSMAAVANGGGTVDLNTGKDADNVLFRDRIAIGPSGLSEDAGVNTVTFLYSGTTPVGSGSDATVLEARNYAVNAVGVFPLGSNNPSRQGIRAQVVMIVPK